MFKFFAGLVALAVSAFAFAQTTPEENDWVNALRPFYADAKAAGTAVTIAVVVNQEDGRTPAQLVFHDATKECQFVVAVRGNSAAQALMTIGRSAAEREIGRVAVFAHEYAHCLQHLADPSISAADPSDVEGLAKREAAADVYALAWFVRNRPADFPLAYRFFQELRLKVARDETGKYDVKAFLWKARDLPAQMAANQASPFDVSMSLVYPVSLSASVASR